MSPLGPEDDTLRFGTGPDEFLRHVREVLVAARAKHAELTKLIGRAELLEIGLASWRTLFVTPIDRARDIDGTLALREDAKKAGLAV